MLRRAVNELEITVRIKADSYLLIKDGRDPKQERKEGIPSAIFVSRSPIEVLREAVRNEAKYNCPDYYLPGGSVRGAWRAHLEKVLRSLEGEPTVCDPLSEPKEGTTAGRSIRAQQCS